MRNNPREAAFGAAWRSAVLRQSMKRQGKSARRLTRAFKALQVQLDCMRKAWRRLSARVVIEISSNQKGA